MSPNFPENVLKHSEEDRQTFQRMSSNIPGNIAKHSGERSRTFREMSSNILRNITKHFGECIIINYYYQFILCWQDVKILQLKYLHNRSYTKNSMLIKVNELKLILKNVKERKSYNNVTKTNFWLKYPQYFCFLYTMRYKHRCKSDAASECLESFKLGIFAATAT